MTDNAIADVTDEAALPKVAPTLKLSRQGLVLSLLAMTAVGLSVYAIFPESVGGPSLPVEVSLDKQPVATTDGGGALMTEVVVIKSLADHEIGRLSIDINDQYLLFRETPLAARETLTLPQRIFTDKRSSARFNPSRYPVEEITVTGQLPNGARGLTHVEFESHHGD